MPFDPPLVGGVFLRREKRFLVYARLDDGREVIAHTNNTGRMTGCLAPGARVWLSPADQPHRKLKWTLELAETVQDEVAGIPGGVLVGLNTARANSLVAEALTTGRLPQLVGYPEMRSEVPVGPGRSRLDFLLTGHQEQPDCWVEVKNVTLVDRRHAIFPDQRGSGGRGGPRVRTPPEGRDRPGTGGGRGPVPGGNLGYPGPGNGSPGPLVPGFLLRESIHFLVSPDQM